MVTAGPLCPHASSPEAPNSVFSCAPPPHRYFHNDIYSILCFLCTTWIYNPIALRMEKRLWSRWPLSLQPHTSRPTCAGLDSAIRSLLFSSSHTLVWPAFTSALDLTSAYFLFGLSLDVTSSLEDLPDPPECGIQRGVSHILHSPLLVICLTFTIHIGSHYPHVAIHLKYGWSKLRCAISENTQQILKL